MRIKNFALFTISFICFILPIQAQRNSQQEETNKKIIQALNEGNQAYAKKNYELAVKKYDEGYILDPNSWETAAILLTNKGIALLELGIEKYNLARKNNLESSVEINQYFQGSADSLLKALTIYEITPLPIDEESRKTFKRSKYNTLKSLAVTYLYLVYVALDKSKMSDAINAIEKYIEVEDNESLKKQAVKTLEKLKLEIKNQ